ncbi:MAG: GTP-binding protein [Candidatus Lokiarchaeota archaeon]|nr:GTP-binding protein [Candidatus Lokiarchaeota archaeon]MBD3341373.1 GTP-binding protein [Candidatus Lokiarchaeota archaeon]
MGDKLITGIVYCKIEESYGPKPYFHFPSELNEEIRTSACIKSVTLLTAEKGHVPDSLVFIPFPSLKLKAIIKFIEWEDETKRGNVGLSTVVLLFREFNDVIFYKYVKNLESIFNELEKDVKRFEKAKQDISNLSISFVSFYEKILAVLEELKRREVEAKELEPFPHIHHDDFSPEDYILKLIVLGDPGVGKTSIVLKYTDNAFNRIYIPTIGVNISEKKLIFKDSRITLSIWDIGGQSKFDLFRRNYYQGADVFALVFDLTNKKSFDNLLNWYNDIKRYLRKNNNLFGFIIGNKSDLTNLESVEQKDISRLTKDLGLEYFQTSALTGENIEKVFRSISTKFLAKAP